MRILLSITSWSVGGAQTFAVRLAAALASRGHEVWTYESRRPMRDASGGRVEHRLPGTVRKVHDRWLLRPFGERIDRGFALSGSHTRPWDSFQAMLLRAFVKRHGIDVVSSHLFDSDRFTTRALQDVKVPIVLSDHGDYRFAIEGGFASRGDVEGIFGRVDAVAHCSAANLSSASFTKRPTLIEEVIHLGIPAPSPAPRERDVLKPLGIPEDAMIFGMVARGIPEKGWAQALHAFGSVTTSARECHLIFVGAGPFLDALQREVEPSLRGRVHFTGHADDPERWIRVFDVGLLPSYFAGESLPVSVIEYLVHGKPVIATKIGSIPEMLEVGDRHAGTLVPSAAGAPPDPDTLANAMSRYATDPTLLASHAALAVEAGRKFDLARTVAAYERLFERVVGSAAQAG